MDYLQKGYDKMIQLLAPAKVNLCLRVLGQTNNGLHELDSIVVFCEFGDKISIQPAKKDNFSITGPFANSLNASKISENLIVKARDAFRGNGVACGPVSIHLEKHIPIGAGLGGGSADAAAILLGLNKIITNPLQRQRLLSIAAQLGSDVPVCLAKKPQRIRSTGNVIDEIDHIHAGSLLLVNPLIPLSTATVFKKLRPPYNAPLPKISSQSAVFLSGFGNDLEPVAKNLVPKIADILLQLRQTPNCRGAQMSGSGATCFGLFDDCTMAKAARAKFDQAGYWTKSTKLYSPHIEKIHQIG